MTDSTEVPEELMDETEELCKTLIELSEQGKIKHTKVFLSNRKKCNEKVLKKIMSEYTEEAKSSKNGNVHCICNSTTKFNRKIWSTQISKWCRKVLCKDISR